MASDLAVRLARPEDIGPASAVIVDAYRGRGLLEDAEEGYEAFLADTAGRARDAELYVALLDDEVVGCVTFCRNGSVWGEIAESGEGEFRMLGVSPAAAGRGVGLALADRCLERSRELGYHAVVLSTLPTMRAAHQLYERLGFARVPERDWQPVPGVRLWAYRLAFSRSAGS